MTSILEFKKINSKSVDEIINYSIPEIQRNLMLDKVEIIYNLQKEFFKEKGYYFLNQTISIGLEVNSNQEYLLDGQHRMTAYKKLREEFPERIMKIDIDYYYCKGMENIEKTYKLINTCTPNPIIDLGIDESKVIQKFENLIEDQFKTYIKPSKKPIRPNISAKIIRDYLTDNEIVKKTKVSGEKLFNLVIELNRFYSKQDPKQFQAWGIKDSHKILDRINNYENKLFVGLYSNYEWIERISDYLIYNIPFEKMQHISDVWRPKITSSLKKAIWKKTNGDTLENGKCYCCSEGITYHNFHCGHDIAIARGGETNSKNCMAICSECNFDMKLLTFDEYKKLIEKQIIN